MLRSKSPQDRPAGDPVVCRTSFGLYFDELPMLTLTTDGVGWTLGSPEAFRRQDRISPLVPFPDVNKVYRSSELWPFFAVRIPSIKRPEIERTVMAEKLDYSDKPAMLARFGKRCISDPFELRAEITNQNRSDNKPENE